MKDPSLAVQAATYKALMEAPGMVAAFGGEPAVYDRVPQNIAATLPYVTIGENQITGTTDGCHDTSQAFVKVDVWAPVPRRKDCLTIAAAVVDVLDDNLTLTGFNCITHTVENVLHLQDRSREFFHSVVTLRYDLEPA